MVWFGFQVSVSTSISVSVSFYGFEFRGAVVILFFSVFGFFLFFLPSRRFCLFISVNIFCCALRLPVAVAFFTQSTVNFLAFFWPFDSGNILNAPLCVGVRVGRGKGKGRGVLNVLDFNLCADCKMLRDNTHTHRGDIS